MTYFNFPHIEEDDNLKNLRNDVKSFLKTTFNSNNIKPQADAWMYSANPEFSKKLGEKGWLGMSFPKKYGGREKTMLERYVITEELLVAGAPVAAHWIADRQSGSQIIRYGTEEQKKEAKANNDKELKKDKDARSAKDATSLSIEESSKKQQQLTKQLDELKKAKPQNTQEIERVTKEISDISKKIARLQKRAGMGLRAIKFRIKDDVLVCLKVLGEGEELLFVTEKGVIVRTNADKISQQSRAATGVKLQRLDEGDHLSEVVLVPHEQTEETDQFNQGKEN